MSDYKLAHSSSCAIVGAFFGLSYSLALSWACFTVSPNGEFSANLEKSIICCGASLMALKKSLQKALLSSGTSL